MLDSDDEAEEEEAEKSKPEKGKGGIEGTAAGLFAGPKRVAVEKKGLSHPDEPSAAGNPAEGEEDELDLGDEGEYQLMDGDAPAPDEQEEVQQVDEEEAELAETAPLGGAGENDDEVPAEEPSAVVDALEEQSVLEDFLNDGGEATAIDDDALAATASGSGNGLKRKSDGDAVADLNEKGGEEDAVAASEAKRARTEVDEEAAAEE